MLKIPDHDHLNFYKNGDMIVARISGGLLFGIPIIGVIIMNAVTTTVTVMPPKYSMFKFGY